MIKIIVWKLFFIWQTSRYIHHIVIIPRMFPFSSTILWILLWLLVCIFLLIISSFFFDFCIICHHYYFKYSQEVHVDLVSCFVRRVSSFSLSLRSFIHSHVIIVIIFHPYFYICFDETFLLLSFWYSQQTDANITLTFRIYFVTQNFLVAACFFYCLSFCHIIWGFCFF